LLNLKDTAQYGLIPVTRRELTTARRRAKRLLDFADEVLRRYVTTDALDGGACCDGGDGAVAQTGSPDDVGRIVSCMPPSGETPIPASSL